VTVLSAQARIASAPRATDAPRLAASCVPAPLVPLDAARAALPGELRFLWDPPGDLAACGAGVAFRVDASGADRFASVRAAAAALWARLDAEGAIAPRLWGGLAFAEGGADAAPWDGFGDASFVLPRWTYTRSEEQAWLTHVDATRDQVDAVLAALARASVPDATPAAVVDVRHGDAATWRAQVEGILAALQGGGVEKIVAARRSEVCFAAAVDASAVLARLADEAGGAWRFAFERERAAFLGAAPERLVRRAGTLVESEAIAGSIAAGRGGELLESRKERAEHDPVVHAIAEALAPRCVELSVPAEPEVRALRHILHLYTPIRGRLRSPAHVLELVEALHPTPAVGGVPRAQALAWIGAHEPAPRGWYAGPVGWFDAAGDGEFVVALRSGLVEGARALIYAGAGIVAGSDPERELAETTLKQRTILRALGARA
jgi:isochorismate synthase